MKRETHKDVEIDGRKWRVGRFDALTGSYIATLLLMQMLPMGLDQQVGLAGIVKGKSLMNKETFFDVQRDCLKVCSEIQQVGSVEAPVMVMLSDGRWGVADVENNLPVVLALTVHTLIFNVSDFFQEGALSSLMESYPALSQLGAKA